MSTNILITGCSSGIGLDAAITLQNRGYRVIATVRDHADAAPLLTENIDVVLLDYANTHSIDSAVQQVASLTGKSLYGLFNNGAYGQVGALEDISTAVLRDQFEANFFGWHTLTRAIVPWMRAQGTGRIVQCSSVLGIAAYAYRGPYNASKYALEGYTDTLRLELHGSGIHVSLIEPGPINTKFRENALAKFRANVDASTSVHQAAYEQQTQRLMRPNQTSKTGSGTLAPAAVTAKLIHALESPNPKIRYRVTRATKIVNVAKRLLSDRQMDWFARKTV